MDRQKQVEDSIQDARQESLAQQSSSCFVKSGTDIPGRCFQSSLLSDESDVCPGLVFRSTISSQHIDNTCWQRVMLPVLKHKAGNFQVTDYQDVFRRMIRCTETKVHNHCADFKSVVPLTSVNIHLLLKKSVQKQKSY